MSCELPPALGWRKSSRSGDGPVGGNCVEVAFAGSAVAVRDSKEPDGPTLAFSPRAWSLFMTRLGS